MISSHPYHPQGALLSGNIFVENSFSVSTLILSFATACILLLAMTLLVIRHINPTMTRSDQWKVLWFVLTGSIHIFFEGYFVYNKSRMASMQDFFGQLWKEYALSDSRYMTSDPLVLFFPIQTLDNFEVDNTDYDIVQCMESWTVITWGPLSLLTAVLITKDSPYRHPIQALVSTGQFYGSLIYYSTCLYEDFALGIRYYRPEPYYFWWYFIFMNTAWLIVRANIASNLLVLSVFLELPVLIRCAAAICFYNSIRASVKAFAVYKLYEGGKKSV